MRRLLQRIVNGVLRLLIRIIAAADTTEFSRIPAEGPLIIIFNHVNFLEVPLLYLRLLPRRIHYMAKTETWKTSVRGWVASNWNSIPVNRGGDPTGAFTEAAGYLRNGDIILMSPEGTRSEDGILRPGRAGAALLALQTGAPLLPVVHWGSEEIKVNLRRFRRTRVTWRVGEPMELVGSAHPRREERMAHADAMMRRIAGLLPEQYRGEYS